MTEVKMFISRKRHEHLMPFFKMENSVVACHEIDGLIKALDVDYIYND